MRIVLEDLRSGEVRVDQVPGPAAIPPRGRVLVRNARSLVSVGTERATIEFCKAGLLDKARRRPELAKKLVKKAMTEGPGRALDAVRRRLEQPLALGYSSAGVVLATGAKVEGFRPGDRVACAGQSIAAHADIVSVPFHLLAPVPDAVSLDQACFGTVGAIGMQAIRLARLELGEHVVVLGLGLVGMVTALLARAAGSHVIGIDIDPGRVAFAEELGFAATGPEDGAARFVAARTGGYLADKVLLCAATPSSEPVALATDLVRQKGVIVVVGDVGMKLSRRAFYDKEIELHVARSYGPGRHDPAYEERGVDYPYPYVRWTENRNLRAVLDLMAAGCLDLTPLISHRFPVDEAPRAYALLSKMSAERPLGIVLEYAEEVDARAPLQASAEAPAPRQRTAERRPMGEVRLGILGAGTFAQSVLLPQLRRDGRVLLAAVHTASGVSAATAARRFGIERAVADPDQILADSGVDGVVIASRHDSHAEYVIRALRAGKKVYVEKPLAMNEEELGAIEDTYLDLERAGQKPFLQVGYNRRFSPLIATLKGACSEISPLVMFQRVCVPPVGDARWILDPLVGGGRIVGEGCHFIDLFCYLARSAPIELSAQSVGGAGPDPDPSVLVTLRFANGSLATLHYLTGASPREPKEVLEVHGGGVSATLWDYRRLRVRGCRVSGRKWFLFQDKGHAAELRAFVDSVAAGAPSPTPFPKLREVSAITLRVAEALRSGGAVVLPANEGRPAFDHNALTHVD